MLILRLPRVVCAAGVRRELETAPSTPLQPTNGTDVVPTYNSFRNELLILPLAAGPRQLKATATGHEESGTGVVVKNRALFEWSLLPC